MSRRLLLALLLAVAPLAGAAPSIALDTAGGDAWAYDKLIEGRVTPEACDEVVVHSPAGEVSAWTDAGRFAAEVPLKPGGNAVQALCRDDGRVVARSEAQHWQLRLPDRPVAWIRTRTDGQTVWLDGGRSERAPAEPAPLRRYQWRAPTGNPAPLVPSDGGPSLAEQPVQGEQLALQAPARDGEYYLTLRVEDAHGRADESTTVFRVVDGEAVAVDLRSEHPAWVDRAVMYGVAPYFFGDGSFSAITARLDEIAALGATAIWLSPVTASPADDFGYAVTDHFRVRAKFGSEAEFRALVQAAHARGLRVIMDFVPNHFSDRHPYHLDATRRGKRSAYYDWFERGPDGDITNYFDWDNLKNLDYDDPEVQNYVIAAFAHWVREYGIDGFRVDASWAVRDRAPEFWPRWRQALKRIDPDLFLLAEASAREPYHVSHGFDAAYDWTWELGEWAWEGVFSAEGADLERLRAALTNQGEGFPDDTLILRFLNNNDTGARFVTRYGPGMTRVASTLLFTLPGVPLVYNGDEVGAAFEPYDEAPPIDWRDPHRLRPHYGRLAELRRETPALWSRKLELVGNDQEQRVLSFRRPGRTPAEDVLVVLNFSAAPTAVAVESLPVWFERAPVRELLSGKLLEPQDGKPRLRLPAYGAAVLQRDSG